MENRSFGRFTWPSLDKVKQTGRWSHSLGSARAAEELRICHICETYVWHTYRRDLGTPLMVLVLLSDRIAGTFQTEQCRCTSTI